MALAGLALSNILLGLFVLASPWIGRWRRLRRRGLQLPLVLLGIYVSLLVLSVAFSHDPARSAGELSEIFTLLVFLLGLVVLTDERRIRMALGAVVALGTFEALVGMAQYGLAGELHLGARVSGTFSHYMTFSGVLMIADLVIIADLASGSVGARRLRDWRWLALVPINLALLASLTRTAWVGLAAGMLVIGALARRKRVVLVIAAALVALVVATDGPVLRRAASIADPSDPTNYDRLCMLEAGGEMMSDRPILGLGPGMVRELYPIYRHPTALRFEVPHLHNAFVQLAAERGIPALAVYLALMGTALARAWRLSRHRGGPSATGSGLPLAAAAVLVAVNVAGLFENNWSDTEVQRLVLVALAIPFCLSVPDEAASS